MLNFGRQYGSADMPVVSCFLLSTLHIAAKGLFYHLLWHVQGSGLNQAKCLEPIAACQPSEKHRLACAVSVLPCYAGQHEN